MYESFFNLRAKPFSLLPDPGFLFFSRAHQEALTILEYGLLNQAGFTVLTGEIGVGKTTLMRCLLDRLDDSFTVGLISNTHQSAGDWMQWVCSSFDINIGSRTEVGLHEAFVDFVIDQYAKGKRTLLIVDEAQNLGGEALEQLRLLSNINSGNDLVLQLMLLGQPQLRELLRRPALQQFVQRVAASYHLGTLDAEETERYILHRLVVAGGREDIFTSEACEAVFGYSGGVPRLINLICDTALVYAYAAGSSSVTAEIVDEFVEAQGDHLLIPLERSQESRRARPRPSAPDSDKPGLGEPRHRGRTGTSRAGSGKERASVAPVDAVARAPARDPVAGSVGMFSGSREADAAETDAALGQSAARREVESCGGRTESPGLHTAAVSRPERFRDPDSSASDERGDRAGSARSGDRPTAETRAARTAVTPPISMAEVLADDAEGGADARVGLGQTALTAAAQQAATGSLQGASAAKRGTKFFWLGGLSAALVFAGVLGLGWLWLGTPAGSGALRSLTNDVPRPDAFELSDGEGDQATTAERSDLVASTRAGEQGQRQAAARALAAPDASMPMPVAKAQPPGFERSAPAADAATLAGANQERRTDLAVTGDVLPVAATAIDTPPAVGRPAAEPPAAEPEASTAEPDPAVDVSAPITLGAGPSGTLVDASRDLVRAATPGQSKPARLSGDAETNLKQPQEAATRGAKALPLGGDAVSAEPVAALVEPSAQPEDALQALEAELREAAISVERTDSNRLVVDLGKRVQFGDGSVALDADGTAFLETLVASLRRSMPVQVHVIAHTDHRGRSDVNKRLSERRAENVAQFLKLNGLPAEHLTHEGKGETEPKVGLAQEWSLGPSVNRRIELELVQLPTKNGNAYP